MKCHVQKLPLFSWDLKFRATFKETMEIKLRVNDSLRVLHLKYLINLDQIYESFEDILRNFRLYMLYE